MNCFKSLCTVALLGAALTGCYGAEVSDVDEEAVSASQEKIFTATIVVVKADGSETVTTERFSRADQLEWQRLREINLNGEYPGLGTAQQAVINTASCSNGAALWLYDAYSATGNMLCLISSSGGGGYAALSSYTLGSGNWSGHVKGYWPGNSSGGDDGFLYNGTIGWCQSRTAIFSAGGAYSDNLSYTTTHGVALSVSCLPG